MHSCKSDDGCDYCVWLSGYSECVPCTQLSGFKPSFCFFSSCVTSSRLLNLSVPQLQNVMITAPVALRIMKTDLERKSSQYYALYDMALRPCAPPSPRLLPLPQHQPLPQARCCEHPWAGPLRLLSPQPHGPLLPSSLL